MLSGRTKFIALLTLFLLLGFLTNSFISYFVAQKSITDQITNDTLPLTSDNIYSEIQRDLLRPIFISSLMANDTFLIDWIANGEEDISLITRYLSSIQRRYNALTTFFVSEISKKYYHPKGVLKHISKEDPQDYWYFSNKRLSSEYEINVDSDTADQSTLTIFINHKVFDQKGQLLGITGIGLAVETLRELLDVYQTRYGREIYFTDRQGNIKLRGSAMDDAVNIRDVQGVSKIATKILASPSGSYTYKQDGHTTYLNARLVPEFDWYLIVVESNGQEEQRILQTLLINIAVSLCITAIVLLLCYFTLGGYQRRLEEMATTDKLTGLANRQSLDIIFVHLLKSAARTDSSLSCMILDIDHFKKVNDTYGHLVGDKVLQNLSELLQSNVRGSDTISRWGGEEFLILLPECDEGFSLELAEKLRKAIEFEEMYISGHKISITASFGISTFVQGDDDASMVNRADKALYIAKSDGRNQVKFES